MRKQLSGFSFQVSGVRIALGIAFLSIILLAPTTLFAQSASPDCTGKFCPLANVEGSKLETLYGQTRSLGDFVSSIFTIAISAGAILAILRLAWAGYLYMGSDNWGSKSAARKVIGDAVLGLLLLIGAWLILFQINPDILKTDFLQGLKGVVGPTAPNAATGYM